jgi:prepilin-type N-terminal cleavage/methylation domain-containing protein
MKKSSRRSNQKGFTLVEILIAIVLLSLLMIGVYSVTDNSSTTIERITREDADFSQVETVLLRLELDFSQIYNPLYFCALKEEIKDKNNPYARSTSSPNKLFPQTTQLGHPIPLIEQPNEQELIFFTSSNRKKVPNSKESNFSWVRYHLQSMPEQSEEERELRSKGDYQLVRQVQAQNPYTDYIDWEKIRPQIVMNYVKSFKILFWAPKKEKFVESLSDLEKPIIIRGVKVIIERYDANDQLETIEKIFRPLFPYFDTSQDKKKTTATTPQVPINDENQR